MIRPRKEIEDFSISRTKNSETLIDKFKQNPEKRLNLSGLNPGKLSHSKHQSQVKGVGWLD